MKIGAPKLSSVNGRVKYSCRVTFGGEERQLWYSVDQQYGDMISSRADAAVVTMLQPAMLAGEDIHVEGELSETLAYHLQQMQPQGILAAVYPRLSVVYVSPEGGTISTAALGQGVSTGFSGGIDSYCLLADHLRDDAPAGHRLTHLTYHNVGSHGSNPSLFYSRYNQLAPVADKLGLPFIDVDSNGAEFHKRGFWFGESHTPRNAAVALVLQNGVSRHFYASAYSYKSIVRGAHVIAHVDPMLLPVLSGSVRLVASGSEYTRVEKTLRVAKIEESYSTLDVCVDEASPENCSRCWKCVRTICTLEVAGLLDRYASVFDLDAMTSRERWIKVATRAPTNPNDQETLSFAVESGMRLPKVPLATRLRLRTPRWLKQRIKSATHKARFRQPT